MRKYFIDHSTKMSAWLFTNHTITQPFPPERSDPSGIQISRSLHVSLSCERELYYSSHGSHNFHQNEISNSYQKCSLYPKNVAQLRKISMTFIKTPSPS